MSHYLGWAINPRTCRTARAYFFDDHFGPRRYGVRFVEDGDDGPIYNPMEAPEVGPPDVSRTVRESGNGRKA